MQAGHGDIYQYTVNRTSLQILQVRKGLEVTTADRNSGFEVLWSLHSSFKHFDEDMFRVLHPTCMRPHLEYCIQEAGPLLIGDVDTLGSVQSLGTNLAKGLSKLHFNDRLKRLNNFPLTFRSTRGDLIMAFHTLNNTSYIFYHFRTNHLQRYRKKLQKQLPTKVRVPFYSL